MASRKRRHSPAGAASAAEQKTGALVWQSVSVVALLALTVWIYAPVTSFEFVSWDDGSYVFQNPHVIRGLSWESVRWAFAAHEPYWHPLTWLSHLLDVQLFGLNAGDHHLVSLLWHLANTVLLFSVLKRMTARPGRALTVAALFAVHPLHVESVAWVAERKDLLSTFFVLFAVDAYGRFAAVPSARRMGVVVLWFGASLLCKPMFVTLPVWLLLLDWWPLGRSFSWKLFTEKIPLMGASVLVGLITYIAQQQVGTMSGLSRLPVGARVANAAAAYLAYLGHAVLPLNLAALYPYPQILPGVTTAVIGGAMLLAACGLFWHFRRFPYLWVGWLWFVVLLLPVIGLVQVGNQAMADRFTYVPLIGVFIAAVWGLSDLATRFRLSTKLLAAIAILIIVALSVTARAQVMTWRNSVTLWTQVLRVTPNSFYAHSALGQALSERGDRNGGRMQQEAALQLRPDDPDANNELGILLAQSRDWQGAINRFIVALRAQPGFSEARKNLASAYYDRGNARAEGGDMLAAIQDFEAAVQGAPDRPEIRMGLALALIRAGRPADALPQARTALALDPHNDRLRQLVKDLGGER